MRNPYAARYAAGSNIVVLEPDVAAVFPNAASANEALRSLANVMAGRTPKPPTRRRSASRCLLQTGGLVARCARILLKRKQQKPALRP